MDIYSVKSTVYRILTSLGAATLPLILAVPVVAFVYLKTRYAAPQGGEQSTPGWAGLHTNYVSLEWLAIFSSTALLGAVGSTVSFFARQGELEKIWVDHKRWQERNYSETCSLAF